MHNHYSDHIAEDAIGSASREWREMACLALKIRNGRCNPIWADQQLEKFTGIFKRLLTDPINEVEREAGR